MAIARPSAQEMGSAPWQPLQTGPYFALVIGNNNYQHLPKLQTAISDADAVAQLLREKFGFKTQVLHDATRSEIFRALNEYRRALSSDSNLLIYYAGHGHHDLDTDTAYWLPADADLDLDSNWISANDIIHEVRAIPSQHVLIVSDSCFSGAIAKNSRSILAGISPRDRRVYLNKLLNSRSRNLMASGGDEPVADRGSGNHSIFAGVFLRSLVQIDEDNFTASDLFQEFIRPAVGGGSRQLPEYDILRDSGHEAGDFIFSRRTLPKVSAEPVAPPKLETQALASSIYVVNLRAVQAKLSPGKQANDEAARRQMLDVIGAYSRPARMGLVVDSSSEHTPVLYFGTKADTTESILHWSNRSLVQVAPPIQAASSKTAAINIRGAIVGTAEGKQASQELQSQFASRVAELENLNKQIADVRARLAAGERTLSSEEKNNLRSQDQDLNQQLQQRQDVFQEQVNEAQGTVMERIGKKMFGILSEDANRSDIGIVLDTSQASSPVLYLASRFELTSRIVGLYDQAFPVGSNPNGKGKSSADMASPARLLPLTAAVIDIRKAIIDTVDGHKANAELQARFAPRQAELENLNKQITDVRNRLSAADRTLSTDEKNRLQAQDQALTQQMQQKTDQFNKDVTDAQTEVVDRIGRKMVDVLDKYARENGLGLVLDTSAQDSAVLYAADQLDITRQIVDLYDQAYPVKAASPSPQP